MCIYIIEQKKNNSIWGPAFKIGYSQTMDGVQGRLRDLQTGNPFELKLYLCVEGDRKVEKNLHNILHPFKSLSDTSRNEWFHDPHDKGLRLWLRQIQSKCFLRILSLIGECTNKDRLLFIKVAETFSLYRMDYHGSFLKNSMFYLYDILTFHYHNEQWSNWGAENEHMKLFEDVLQDYIFIKNRGRNAITSRKGDGHAE